MNRNAKVIMRSPLCVNQLRFNLSDECDAMRCKCLRANGGGKYSSLHTGRMLATNAIVY